MRLSIVIPVFNEERQIVGCLESIRAQTVAPDEIIVVDNNCQDKTIALAKQFPSVRIVTEKKQGRGFARSAGFDAANGEIIGRIDADSRLDPHWVERVIDRFSKDKMLMGLTGMGSTSFIPGVEFIRTTLFTRSYYWYVHASFRTVTMWGATMAIRKDAWNRVRLKVCNDDSLVHEDQDVSLWIAASGDRIEQDNSVRISTSGQTYRYLPKFLHYRTLFERTKRLHRQNGNLSNPVLHRLGFWQTFPGRVWSVIFGIPVTLFIALMYPIDYLIAVRLRRTSWLKK